MFVNFEEVCRPHGGDMPMSLLSGLMNSVYMRFAELHYDLAICERGKIDGSAERLVTVAFALQASADCDRPFELSTAQSLEDWVEVVAGILRTPPRGRRMRKA